MREHFFRALSRGPHAAEMWVHLGCCPEKQRGGTLGVPPNHCLLPNMKGHFGWLAGVVCIYTSSKGGHGCHPKWPLNLTSWTRGREPS